LHLLFGSYLSVEGIQSTNIALLSSLVTLIMWPQFYKHIGGDLEPTEAFPLCFCAMRVKSWNANAEMKIKYRKLSTFITAVHHLSFAKLNSQIGQKCYIKVKVGQKKCVEIILY